MRRGETAMAASIFVVALALRLGVIAQLNDEPLFRTPQLDALEYVQWGAQLAAGDFSWPDAPIHAPGYPLLIGLVLATFRSLMAVQVVHAILGSLAAVMTFAIARRLFGPIAAVAGGLLHATYAPLILIDVSILAEGLFVFLLTSALLLLTRPSIPIIGAGLVLGAAIIVRPTAAALIPLFAWYVARNAPRRAAALATFLIATAVPIVPVLAMNRMLAIQTSGGMNFYIGNTPARDGTAWARPGGSWDAMRGLAWRAGIASPAGEDRFYVRQALSEITDDPLGWMRVVATKAMWLIQDEEVRDSHSFHFFASSSSLLRWLPRFGVVLALAMCGMFITRCRPGLLSGYAVVIALTVIFLVAGSRYRIPLMPALFVFAGAGVAAAISGRRRPALAAIFVATIIVANVREHSPSHEFSEELTMTALALKNEGEIEGAEEVARRAITTNRRRDAAWVALGDIQATHGDWGEAEQSWRTAISIDANNVRAWAHLAHAHFRRGDHAQAEAALRRALSIRNDGEAARNLAVLRNQTSK